MELNSQDFRWPAEWEPHDATLVAWPVNADTWPDIFNQIPSAFGRFVAALAQFEAVLVLAGGLGVSQAAAPVIDAACSASASRYPVRLLEILVNDSWCRDYGPMVLTAGNSNCSGVPAIVLDWDWNCWGGKYPPWQLDAAATQNFALHYHLPVLRPGIVLEGGAVDGDGDGTVLTTVSCLLNPNRNMCISQTEMERILREFLGARSVVWLSGKGIVGDDTDGHIDQLARFAGEQRVVVAEAYDADAPEAPALRGNFEAVESGRTADNRPLCPVALTLPQPAFDGNQRLPMSYCNFCLVNGGVVVPAFRDPADDLALQQLQDCFPERTVIEVDATDLVRGLGSLHCLSQQLPAGILV